MRLNTSYRQIFAVSAPIMIGSAAQNVIALTDSVFLYYLSEEDFASIGFVGVFYLMIAAIGFGFSRAGQILIARRAGEGDAQGVGSNFFAMFYFELALAVGMLLFMMFGAPYLFHWLIDSPIIYEKSLEYLSTRQWGVFFSYTGVALIALYTGLARASFVIVDTVVLVVVNTVLNYAFVFGHWGFPAMGIAGAGLASTISEVAAFIVFVGYMFWDKPNREFLTLSLPRIDLKLIKQQYRLASPIVLQAFVGLGSWFVFFAMIEKMGEHELAVTNLVRMIYLVLSIPTWGYSAGVNTLVSHFIGSQKRQAVVPILWKTAKLCLFTTLLISLPIVLFPHEILYPLLGDVRSDLIYDAKPVLVVLLFILITFSVSSVLFSGVAGVGATAYGLRIQTIGAVLYIAYAYLIINHTDGGLSWAWSAEIVYWLFTLSWTLYYLYSRRWHALQI